MTLRTRPWWPWLRRGLSAAFFVGVAWLVLKQARAIEWGEVREAIAALPAATLAAALALGLASHALYSSFDLLGRRLTGHRVPVPLTMATTFVSYAFNLNFGALVGGLAFRYRLYARLGLDAARITRIVALSMLTNWSGYLVLAGLLCLVQPFDIPEGWRFAGRSLQPAGALLLVVAAAYLAANVLVHRPELRVRGHVLPLPGGRLALLQLAMSCANWMLMGAMVWTLLGGQVDYPTVLGVLLVAAIAGVITHVPAGLGVLEAVFVALLADRVPQATLLGALLVYRGLYYLLPLAVALVTHLALETRLVPRARRRGLLSASPRA